MLDKLRDYLEEMHRKGGRREPAMTPEQIEDYHCTFIDQNRLVPEPIAKVRVGETRELELRLLNLTSPLQVGSRLGLRFG